jgi:hypothetical protein
MSPTEKAVSPTGKGLFENVMPLLAVVLYVLALRSRWLLCFAALPILTVYLTCGKKRGDFSLAAMVVLSPALFVPRFAAEVLLSSVIPGALLGRLSVRNVTVDGQTRWYSESLLLQRFTLLSYVTFVLLALLMYLRESSLRSLFRAAADTFFRKGDLERLWEIRSLLGGGTIAAGLLMSLLNFSLAHLIAKKIFKKNIRPGFDFGSLRVSRFWAIMFFVAPFFAVFVALMAYGLFPNMPSDVWRDDVRILCPGAFSVGEFASQLCGVAMLKRLADRWKKYRLLFLGVFACAVPLLLWLLPFWTFLGLFLAGIIDAFYPILRKTEADSTKTAGD